MTPRTASRPRPQRTAKFWTRVDWRWVIVPAACVFAAILTSLISTTPKLVDRVTFENTGPYAMNIDVSGAARNSWLGLGTVGQRSSVTIQHVIDQHATWVFRFSSQGADAGTIEVNRNDLAASDWHVTIPVSVADGLQARGVPPTP
jgi:hypothetical protein